MATVAELFALAWQHHQTGGFAQAEYLYRQILQFHPGHPDAWCFLAGACQAQRKLVEAEMNFRQAIRLVPDYGSAHCGLGALLAGQNRPAEAAVCFQHAVSCEPDNFEAHYLLGLALNSQDQSPAAIVHFRRALQLKPHFPEALSDLGIALAAQDQLNEAVSSFQAALRLRPEFAEAHYNFGIALGKQGRVEEEIAEYHEALRLRPDYAVAHVNLGNALQELGQWAEALAQFDKALRIDRDLPMARWNRAWLLLLRGDFNQGWPEYEWRWAQYPSARRHLPQPLWNGSDLAGRTILLYAEQGLGDTLQFLRYVPLIKQTAGKVIVECQAPLMRLLAGFGGGAGGIDQLVPQGSPLPGFDVQAPLLSLPAIFHTTLATVPAPIPYLRADANLVEHWRQQLAPLRGFKVGINWQGSTALQVARKRTIPLDHFGRLARLPGVHLISLQKGAAKEELRSVAGQFPVIDLGAHIDEEAGAFMDTAAIMQNLDLVISSDTATPHLAGALGAAVWVALPKVPDWRWLLDREDTPWYPTMRLFRQTHAGQWADVFERLAEALTRAQNNNDPQIAQIHAD